MATANVFYTGKGTRSFANAGVTSSPTVPSNIKGDVALLAVQTTGKGSPLTPAGWTATGITATSDINDQSDGSISVHLFWQRNVGLPDSIGQPTVDVPNSYGAHQAQIVCFRGCVLSGSPIHASGTTFDNTANTTLVLPAIPGITLDQASVFYFAAIGDNSFFTDSWVSADLDHTAPIEIVDQSLNATESMTMGLAWGATTASSVSAGTLTAGTSEKDAALAIAFEPDPLWGARASLAGVGAMIGGSGAVDVQPPDYYDDGDILVLICTDRDNTGPPLATHDLSGDGWTLKGDIDTGAFGVFQSHMMVYWKRASGTQAAVTLPAGVDHNLGIMLAVRFGPTTGDPFISGFDMGMDDTADMVVDSWPAVTTLEGYSLIILAAAVSDNSSDVFLTSAVNLADPTLATLAAGTTSGGADHALTVGMGGLEVFGPVGTIVANSNTNEHETTAIMAIAGPGAVGGSPSAAAALLLLSQGGQQ